MSLPVPGTKNPKNPVNFCDKNTRSIFCSKEVPLGGSWVGAGHQKDQVMIRSLKFSSLLPTSPERREELEMELIIDHVCMRKLP